jgi:hypothetical protein
MLRAFAITVIFVSVACIEALACRGESFERTIIFDEVPNSIDAPIVVEARIIDKSERIEPTTGAGWIVMNAQIDSVIKGSIGTPTLKIVTQGSDCTVGFGAGSHGIIVGTLRQDAQGTPELVAIQESKADRAIRKARERRK